MIALANPNNPSGTAAAPRELLRIVEAAPNAAVLIDEAYFEFYGESVMPFLSQYDNLFVARTFSKAYGLAGLRIGILAGSANQMEMVRRVSSPYNVNAAALAVLPVALSDQQYVADYLRQVFDGRRRIDRRQVGGGDRSRGRRQVGGDRSRWSSARRSRRRTRH